MKALLGTSVVLALLAGISGYATGCSESSREASAEITSFEPASGTYRAGDRVISSLRLENTGTEKQTFWVGYSVRDGSGRWHDVPANPVTLEPGEESETQEKTWGVPDKTPPSGPYKVAMAVWSGPPEEEESSRIANTERGTAFTVIDFREDFDSLNEGRWNVTSRVDKKLGRSYLEPENVSVTDGNLRLELPAGSSNGAEIASRKLYQYGSYRARIKAADAPSSITGFFLYKEPDFYKEIDIEIFNDPSGRILFTTYAGGEETDNVEKKLSFDPTKDFHEYRFDFYPGKIEFYVDGERMHRFTGGLPKDPMRLYVNAWFPTWLSGEKPESDRYTSVDWLEH